MLAGPVTATAQPTHAAPYIAPGNRAACAVLVIPMAENTEADVRLLVRQVAELALQGGGMDRQTYDVLSEASAALAAFPGGGSCQDTLRAVEARLRACELVPVMRAA